MQSIHVAPWNAAAPAGTPVAIGSNMMKAILASVLLFFVGINLYALTMSGWDGFLSFIDGANGWTVLAVTDLCISLGLVSVWLIQDAKSRGRSALGYVLLTITTGSIGPLVYLLNRDTK